MEPEQDGEDDAAEIAHGADRAAQNTIGMRVDMWDQREVGSVVAVSVKADL